MSTDFEKKQWGVKALGITYRYNGHIISASMRVSIYSQNFASGNLKVYQ